LPTDVSFQFTMQSCRCLAFFSRPLTV
jgi:hypothetical protein